MDAKEQENLIHDIGNNLAAVMKDFYGSVKFNLCGGRYVNSNLEQSLKPKPQKEKGK